MLGNEKHDCKNKQEAVHKGKKMGTHPNGQLITKLIQVSDGLSFLNYVSLGYVLHDKHDYKRRLEMNHPRSH